jgi:anti-sigma regulatory factor (Ser/Thr protein kinase)
MFKELLSVIQSKPVRELATSAFAKFKLAPNWRNNLVNVNADFKRDQEHETFVLVDYLIKQLADKKWESTQIDMVRFVSHELLINAFKHGFGKTGGGKVRVRITFSDRHCRMLITNPGKGFDLQSELQRQGHIDGLPEGKRALALIYTGGTQLTQPYSPRCICALIKRTTLRVEHSRLIINGPKTSD